MPPSGAQFQFGHVWSRSFRVVSLPLYETISILTPSKPRSASPLPCVDLLLIVVVCPEQTSPLNDPRNHVRPHPATPGSGLTSYFLIPPVSPTCCNVLALHRHRSEPYDPYLPRGGSSSNPSAGGNPKTAAIQAQIDDTVGIMRDNITKVAERGERLDQLQDKTGMFSPFFDNNCARTTLAGLFGLCHELVSFMRRNRQPRYFCPRVPQRCRSRTQGMPSHSRSFCFA